MQKGLKTLV